MPTIAELGQLAAQMEKQSSTALVRQIAKGLLSPAAIQQAAKAMPVGKFRTVAPLGRGQFSLADKVVGNMRGTAGSADYAGLMARKMPTRAVHSPAVEYRPVQRLTNQLNEQFAPEIKANPIAPFVHVGPKGGFQRLATEKVTVPPNSTLNALLDDKHPGNFGPHGQRIDYEFLHNKDLVEKAIDTKRLPPSIDQLAGYPLLRPDNAVITGSDALGNLPKSIKGLKRFYGNSPDAWADRQALWAKQQEGLKTTNAFIRKYWSSPKAQQRSMLSPQALEEVRKNNNVWQVPQAKPRPFQPAAQAPSAQPVRPFQPVATPQAPVGPQSMSFNPVKPPTLKPATTLKPMAPQAPKAPAFTGTLQ